MLTRVLSYLNHHWLHHLHQHHVGDKWVSTYFSVVGLQHEVGQEQRVVSLQAWRQTWVMGSCMSVKTVGKQRGRQHHGSPITVPVYKNHSCSKHLSHCWPPRVSRSVWKGWGLLPLLAHFWCLHQGNACSLKTDRTAKEWHMKIWPERPLLDKEKTCAALNPVNIINWWTSWCIKPKKHYM